ncbi:hypothetical protein DER44DRAFT_794085, partial [Fusarium oxysporum]
MFMRSFVSFVLFSKCGAGGRAIGEHRIFMVSLTYKAQVHVLSLNMINEAHMIVAGIYLLPKDKFRYQKVNALLN